MYNSLIVKPIFVEKSFLNKVEKKDLTEEEINELVKIGYYLKDEDFDNKILNIYRENFKKDYSYISLMYLIPTNKCNLACKYCFIGKLKDKRKQMEEETMYHAINVFNKNSNGNKGSILFYGGEPLLNYDLVRKQLIILKEIILIFSFQWLQMVY